LEWRSETGEPIGGGEVGDGLALVGEQDGEQVAHRHPHQIGGTGGVADRASRVCISATVSARLTTTGFSLLDKGFLRERDQGVLVGVDG